VSTKGAPAMSDEYDQYLSKHYSHVSTPASLERKKAWVLSNHGSKLPPSTDAVILDVGPGFGNIIQLLHDKCGYKNVNAIDISPEVVSVCNTILPGSTKLVGDTVGFLNGHQGEFDLILLLHVLEHISKNEVLPFLGAVHNALKSGGRVIVEVPNSAHPITGINMRYADFTHHVGFTDRSLEFVMLNAGFSEVSLYGCKVPWESPLRSIQRAGQNVVEMLLGLIVRLYMPTKPSILTSILGACATK